MYVWEVEVVGLGPGPLRCGPGEINSICSRGAGGRDRIAVTPYNEGPAQLPGVLYVESGRCEYLAISGLPVQGTGSSVRVTIGLFAGFVDKDSATIQEQILQECQQRGTMK